MRVKGLVALLAAVLSISFLPQVAHAADLPSFEIKSVSATEINPGDTVTWKIQVNLIPGWVKYLNLNLIDPSGQVRQLTSEIEKTYEVKEKKSVEISLSLKTNEYDLAGKYRLQWGYLANVTEVLYYDPINGKDYMNKGANTFAQNFNKYDFTIRDAGTGKQKTPQLIESISFSKSQIDPGQNSKLSIKTVGTGALVNAYVYFSTPDGNMNIYCDALNQGNNYSCLDLVKTENSYSFSLPVWTAEDSSPGTYKVTQITLGYRNGQTATSPNDSATWGGNVQYSETETINNGVKSQTLSQFSQGNLSFTLLDAGQGKTQAPIWTELAWANKSVPAGSTAKLTVTANGFSKNLANISVPIITNLNGKNDFVYTNQGGQEPIIRQIKPVLGRTMLPATKSGTFEVEIYIPRSAKPGTYAIAQLILTSTSCALSTMKDIYTLSPINNQNCQSWPNTSHTSFYMGSLMKDFGSSGIYINTWAGYVNPLSLQIEVTAPVPLVAPNLEEVDVTPASIEYKYQYSSEQSCTPAASTGDLSDEKIMRDSYWIFKVINLKPDTPLKVNLTCTDTTGAKAESSVSSRTAKPIPPASPKLTLDATTTTSATFSIGIRDGFKYTVKAESGEAQILGNKESGYKVEVTGLKPGVKTYIVATITDSYGQSTSTEPFYFAAALPEKPAKPTLISGKATTSRVEFKYEKLSNLDYELTVSEGDVSDIRGSVIVSGLAPNTKITASLKVTDEFGQSATSDLLVLKSAIPELPAMPILYLSKASSDSISLRFAPRAGLKYSVKASMGTASITDGSILISGLKPMQKVEVSLVMSDIYGQYKSSDFYTFATTAAPKATAKTSITCVKGKTSKVITAVKPTCPAGYTKK